MADVTERFIADAQAAHRRVAELEQQLRTLWSATPPTERGLYLSAHWRGYGWQVLLTRVEEYGDSALRWLGDGPCQVFPFDAKDGGQFLRGPWGPRVSPPTEPYSKWHDWMTER